MGWYIATTTALRALTPDDGDVHFVKTKLAGYMFSLGASGTDDDDNLIADDGATGRWYKLFSSNSGDAWNYQNLTSGSITATNRSAYICASSGSALTVTLPATPSNGHTVRVIQTLSGWDARVKIARNGEKIDGVAADINFATAYTVATLTYSGSTNGWIVDSNKSYASDNTVTTLTYASDGDTNGVLYYIGTAKNTIAFANPASAKVANYTITNSAISAQTGMSDRATSIVTASSIGDCFVLDLSVDTARSLRLVKLSIRNSSTASHALRGFAIYGAQSTDWVDKSASSAGVASFNKVPWRKIIQFTDNTSMAASTSAYGSYDVNDTEFCSLYKIMMTQARSDTTTYSCALGEWEWYGDLVWA